MSASTIRWACGAWLAASLAFAGAGRADPPSTESALERLSEAERDALRRKFPQWDEWDVERRERVARRVLTLREIPPERHGELYERARRWRERPADRPPGGVAAHAALVGGLLGERLVQALPEEVAARLVKPGTSRQRLGHHLVRLVWPRIAEFEGRRLVEGGLEDLPPPFLATEEGRRLADAVAEVRAADLDRPDGRRRLVDLGHRAIGLRMDLLRRRVGGPHLPPEAARRLADLLWERWRAPCEDALSRLRTGGGEVVLDLIARREAAVQVFALEQLAHGVLAGDDHAEARGWADRLVRHLLVHTIGADAAAVAALPSPGDAARGPAIRRLLGPVRGIPRRPR